MLMTIDNTGRFGHSPFALDVPEAKELNITRIALGYEDIESDLGVFVYFSFEGKDVCFCEHVVRRFAYLCDINGENISLETLSPETIKTLLDITQIVRDAEKNGEGMNDGRTKPKITRVA